MNPLIWLARWRARRAYRRSCQWTTLPFDVIESMWRHERQCARICEGDEFETGAVRANTIRSGDDIGYWLFGLGRLARAWRRDPDDFL